MQADNIDEVINRLGDIVEWARNERSRLGYFAALYRRVTVKIKEGIHDGVFENGERLERLDVIFANLYLEAFERYHKQDSVGKSWQLALEASRRWWLIVLQHLFLGINAHINLDLGIAAARTSPGEAVYSLKNDFNRVNDILATLVDQVERQLADIWPTLRLLDWAGGRSDELLMNFSLIKARQHAWRVAEDLALLEEADQIPKIRDLDQKVADLGHRVRHPGVIVGAVARMIRLGERGTIPEIIDILSQGQVEERAHR